MIMMNPVITNDNGYLVPEKLTMCIPLTVNSCSVQHNHENPNAAVLPPLLCGSAKKSTIPNSENPGSTQSMNSTSSDAYVPCTAQASDTAPT